ncbi:MAG: hypothetical protein Q7V01_04390, partial [Vicinamibacterales bacterium]|nr:hypothetical protein [Vicinamibacterales bacterium]
MSAASDIASPSDAAAHTAVADAQVGAAVDRDSKAGLAVAQVLVDAGYLTSEQVTHARRVQAKLSSPRSFTRVLRDLRMVTEAQVRECLQTRRVSVRLGDLLVELGYLTTSDLKLAVALQKSRPGTKLGAILIDNDLVSEHEVFEVLAFQLGFIHVPVSECVADPQLAKQVPVRWMRTHEAVPIRVDHGAVLVAFARPHDEAAVTSAKRVFGNQVMVGISARRAVEAAIDRLESSNRQVVSGGDTGAVALAETMLADAVRERASDIHIEPFGDRLRL